MSSPYPRGAGLAAVSVAAFTEWPLKVRVKLNSPNLWPTMFSVTYTGMNFFPLCTATVWPTISGTIVERRDQVRITFFSFRVFMPSTFVIRWASINGPFFVERAIYTCLFRPAVHDERIGPLIVARLVSTSRLSPRSYRVTSARSLSFAATVWMVDRVHRHTAVHRTTSQPAGASSLADGDVLVIEIADLSDSRHALYQHPAGLAGRQLQQRVLAFLGHQLCLGAGRTRHLRALARLQLNVVD